MKYQYYYNNVPGKGLCRNNLIYTSLISSDQKTFVQWYHNDTEYHHDQNQVIDPSKMDEKWQREITYITLMSKKFPDLVPNIIDIDHISRKLYLQIDGPDFWERSQCDVKNYDTVLPNWKEQMLNIILTHKSIGIHKYSMHPSSYFVIDGKLKSINYFFAYDNNEPNISIAEVESHIYTTRQDEMRKHIENLGIKWDEPQSWPLFDKLCWESFRTNYPDNFINEVLQFI